MLVGLFPFMKVFLLLFLNLFSSLISIITFKQTHKKHFLFFFLIFLFVFAKDLFLIFNFIIIDPQQTDNFTFIMKRVLELDVMLFIFWGYTSYIKKLYFLEKLIFYLFLSFSFFYLMLGLGFAIPKYRHTSLILNFLFYVNIYAFLFYGIVKIIRYHSSFYYKKMAGKRFSFVVIYALIFLFLIYFILTSYYKFLYIYLNLTIAFVNFIAMNIFSSKKYKELKNKIHFMEKEHKIQFDMINKINEVLVKDSSSNTLFTEIITNLSKALKAQSGAIFIYDEKEKILQAQAVAGLYPPLFELHIKNTTKIEHINEILLSKEIPVNKTYIGIVAHKRKTLLIRDLSTTSSIVKNCMGLLDFKSIIVSPMVVKKELIGVLSLVHSPGKNFTLHDKDIVETIAKQAAVSIKNIWFYNDFIQREVTKRELKIASYIQKNLFPKSLPQIKNLSIFSYNKPANEMGGDYYDIIPLGQSKLGVFICDVAGKGVPAALIMVMMRSIFRTISTADKDPGRILTNLNKYLNEQNSLPETFATAFYCIYDTKSRILQYANAGHSPLLIFSKNNIIQCDTEGLPIGIADDSLYTTKEKKIKKDDILLFYTDGISEAKDVSGDFYGEDRMIKVIKKNIDKRVEFIGSQIIHNVDNFVKNAKQYDDQTIVLIKC